ncbi:invasion associated locus B family protein [Hwanghaeella sp.]|uniref:invasion associated locus B family protein n=1 Tax=Hwanghaeella sp. TaxID=2605943 RepID=UPI003CCC308C
MQAFESKTFLKNLSGGFRGTATRRNLIVGLLAGFAFISTAQPGSAQDVVLGAYNDWKAHSYQEPEGKVCNMWSRPIKSEPSNVRRGDIYAFITHRPALKSWSAVSFQMGYPLNSGEEVSLQIGNEKFRLIAEGEAAFADEADDPKIAAAMRRGNRMVVRGVSTRGTRTIDTYSLSGVTAATKALDGACPK